MPTLVGEALVRVRVLSAGLSNDIRNAVRDSVRASSADLDNQGQTMGQRISNGVSKGMSSNDTSFKNAGQQVGQKFGTAVDQEVKKAEPNISASTRRIGTNAGKALVDGVGSETRKTRAQVERDLKEAEKGFKNIDWSNLGKDIGKSFNVGIGAARMGPAAISLLALAGPSMIAWAAGVGAAMGAVLAAGLSSVVLAGGLLFLAFKSGAAGLDELKKSAGELAKELGTPVAQGMLGGMNDAVAKLRGAIPALSDSLNQVGQAFGRVAVKIADAFTTPANIDRFNRILQTNAGFVDNLGTMVAGLSTAFLILMDASKPVIDMVGKNLAHFGDWAAAALDAASANGTLSIVMDKMTIIGQKLFDGLGKIGPAIGKWLVNLNVDSIINGMDRVGKLLSTIFQIAGQIRAAAGPNLAQAFDNFLTVLQRAVDSGMVGKFAAAISQVILALSGLLVTLTNSPIGTTIAGIGLAFAVFSGIIMSVLSPAMKIAGTLFTVLKPLVVDLGLGLAGLSAPALAVAAAVAAVVAVFALAWTQSEKLRNAIGDLVIAVKDKLIAIWEQLQPKFEAFAAAAVRVWEALQRLGQIIGDFLAPIIEALIPTVVNAFDVIGKMIGTTLDLIIGLFNIFADILSGNWGQLWEDIKSLVSTAISDIGGIMSSGWNLIWSIAIQPLIDLGGKIADWFNGTFVPWISENWTKIPGYIALALVDLGSKAVSAFADMLSALLGWFTGTAIPWFGDRFVEVVDACVSGLKGLRDGILNAFDAARLDLGSWFTGTFFPWLNEQWKRGIATSQQSIAGDAASTQAPFEQKKTWLGEWFNNTFTPWLADQWSSAITPISTGNINMTTPFENGRLALGGWFSGFFGWLGEQWTNLVGTVEVGLQDLFPAVSRKFEEVRIGIGDFFTGFLGWLLGKWGEIAAQPLGVLVTLKDNVMGFFYQVGAAVNAWFFGEEGSETGHWSTIAQLPAILAALPGAAMTWFSQLGGNMGQWFNDQVTSHSISWQSISNLPLILASMPGKAMQWFSQLGGEIGSWFGGMFGSISSAWAVIAGLPAVLGGMANMVMGFFQNVGSSIGGWFGGITGTISGWWERIKELPGEILGGMAGIVTGALGGVVGALTSPFTTAYNTIAGILSSIVSVVQGAVSVVQGAWNFITGTAHDIATAAASAISAAGIANAALAAAKVAAAATTTVIAGTATTSAAGQHAVATGSISVGSGALRGFAAGGVVHPMPGGMLAIIGEGRRSERVDPLDSQGLSTRDRAIIREIAGMALGQSSKTTVEVAVAPGFVNLIDARILRGENGLARRIQYGRPVNA